MNEMRLARKGGIDRGGLVAWMKETIHRAESLPRARLVRRVIAPAGMAVEVLADDPVLAEGYFARLAAGPAQTVAPLDRLYVLSGDISAIPVPHWHDADCPAKTFQAVVAKANLRTAYPLVPGFWQFLDAGRRIGIQLAPNRARLPRWDAAAPLRRHLHWLMEERGGRLAHAATLGWQGRGLLICGKGGSGKSSTTLAGLAAGLSTAGDDYVAITGGEAPAARLLYRIVKQDPDGLARIPALSATFAGRTANWQKKIEFNPEEVFPGAFAESVNLAAVMLPHIAHVALPSIAPIAPATAMLSLMSTNLHQHIGELETGMAFFADILRRLPCFRIDLAHDAMANGAALREFIAALAR
jgi:hypothetical protein